MSEEHRHPNWKKDCSPCFDEMTEQISQLKQEREETLELVGNLAESTKALLDGIDYASVEVLNGKYSHGIYDEEEAYKLGAHIFFKLIGKAYPNAKQALAAFNAMKERNK